VTFTVPEGDFQRIRQTSNGFTKALQVEALSQESGAILGHGTLNVADNRVDQNTGSVELKARFDNPGAALWPGQFVNVRLALQTLSNVPVVPLAALNRGPQGQFVFVVGSDHKAVIRPVTLTTTQGQTAVIQSGLRPGEIVVLDGQMTLTNGSPVRITHLDAGPAA
jgi:multidrug efflux system membrane fusion protein